MITKYLANEAYEMKSNGYYMQYGCSYVTDWRNFNACPMLGFEWLPISSTTESYTVKVYKTHDFLNCCERLY